MIRTIGKYFLTTLLLFFMFTFLSIAQTPTVDIVTDEEGLVPEQTFQVDLAVQDFTDMLGVQFTLKWDPEVLSFISVDNFGIADISLSNNFGLMNVEGGLLSFLWYDVNLAGVGIENDSTLFSLNFKVIGNPEDTASVMFTNTPTGIEFSDTSPTGILNPVLNNFEMVIGLVSTDFNSAPHLIQVKDVYPNPVSDNSQVDFHLAHSTDLDFFIFDEGGKMVLHTREYFTSGDHSFFLKKGYFPASGKYLLKMVSEEFEVQQKLVFIGK